MQAPGAPKGRLEFLHTKPPLNYVAGHGRGATGFTTRSDIGPALQAPVAPKGWLHTKPPLNHIAGHGCGAMGFTTRSDIGPALQAPVAPKDRLHTKPPLNYIAGHGRGATGFTTRSDIGPALQAPVAPKVSERYRSSNPKTTEQFADQKRKLHTMSTEEWDRKPETGDNSLRNKKKRFESFVPFPNALLEKAMQDKQSSETVADFENSEPEKARERGGTEKVWMKSAIVERELGNTSEERSLLDEGLKRYPSFYKLWLMLGQLEERLGNLDQAKGAYELGLKHCSSCCVPLWLSLARLEEKANGLSKARAVLTMARTRNPKNPELWLAAVRAEARNGNKKEADALMTKALQECPKSGVLWAASIEMVPRKEQKMKSKDAYTNCGEDPHVLAAVGKLFWHDKKFDKSRSYFNRVVTLAPDIGDFWALYYKFEMQHGTEENQKDVLNRCVAAGPKHGEKWQAVSKALENLHLPTDVLLKKVVGAMGKEELHASSACS